MSDTNGRGERAKLRVKLGNHAELEYEGSTQFLKDEVMPAIGKIFHLVELRADLALTTVDTAGDETPTTSLPKPATTVAGHTTGSIATQLQAESASDLLMAAATYLTLVAGQQKFTRSELLDAMQSATGFYKKSDRNNLSKTLQAVIKAGRLREAEGGHFVLSPRERESMEQALAQNG